MPQISPNNISQLSWSPHHYSVKFCIYKTHILYSKIPKPLGVVRNVWMCVGVCVGDASSTWISVFRCSSGAAARALGRPFRCQIGSLMYGHYMVEILNAQLKHMSPQTIVLCGHPEAVAAHWIICRRKLYSFWFPIATHFSPIIQVIII